MPGGPHLTEAVVEVAERTVLTGAMVPTGFRPRENDVAPPMAAVARIHKNTHLWPPP